MDFIDLPYRNSLNPISYTTVFTLLVIVSIKLRDMMIHLVVNEGLRVVYSKDMLSEVGLAYWEVIHSRTPAAFERYLEIRRGVSI